MNELELIHSLTANLATNQSVVTGPGDDCAVLAFGSSDEYLLFKTDAVVEGVHFTPETEPERVGHKALGRCLSDIAAMGGEPKAAVVTLGLPPDHNPEFLGKMYAGMNRLASQFNVAIVGGETTAIAGQLFINVAMIGTVPRSHVVHRSGATAGDAIFVTGELGGSLAGKHLDFTPRIMEARWLVTRFRITSMIDLSDGLAGDLRHVLRASRAGGELLSQAIPISRPAKLQARGESAAKPPLFAALTDGEDFELLFTIRSADAVPLLDGWKKEFPAVRLSCIGKITGESGLRIRDKHGVRELNVSGYVHFS